METGSSRYNVHSTSASLAAFAGLRTRLCAKCWELTSHRTLYVKTNTGGRSKSDSSFYGQHEVRLVEQYRPTRLWAGTGVSRLPLVLAIAVVNALEEGPLDLDELIVSLRRQQKECLKAAGQVYNGLAKMVKIRTNKVDPAVDR